MNVPYWSSSTSSIDNFKNVYDKQSTKGLRAQYNAHKKALQDGSGQTGQITLTEIETQEQAAIMQHIIQITNHLRQPSVATISKDLSQKPTNVNNANNSSGSTTTASSTAIVPKLSLVLWEVMSEMHGLQWFTEYGDPPNNSWIVEIERLTHAELAKGKP